MCIITNLHAADRFFEWLITNDRERIQNSFENARTARNTPPHPQSPPTSPPPSARRHTRVSRGRELLIILYIDFLSWTALSRSTTHRPVFAARYACTSYYILYWKLHYYNIENNNARTKIFRLSENLSQRNFSDVSAHKHTHTHYDIIYVRIAVPNTPSSYALPAFSFFFHPLVLPTGVLRLRATIHTRACYPNLRSLFTTWNFCTHPHTDRTNWHTRRVKSNI